MNRRLKSLVLILFVAAFSVNFMLYSSQRFSPPTAESKSYSVAHCSSHQGSNGVTQIIELFIDSEEQNGVEKLCFCYSCCKDRTPPTLSGTGILTLLNNDYNYLRESYELWLSDKSYKNLPIRSPPVHT